MILIITPIINANFPAVAQFGLDGQPLLDAKGDPTSLPAWNAWGWRIPFILSAFPPADLALYPDDHVRRRSIRR